MRMSACSRGKLKNSRRYHSSKNKKDTGQGCLKSAVDMEAPGNGLLFLLIFGAALCDGIHSVALI